MGNERYRALLVDVAAFAEVDPDELLQTQRLEFKGTSLRFDHVPCLNVCRVAILLNTPPESSEELLRNMLYYNCNGEDLLPTIGLDPASAKPIMFLHFPLFNDAAVGMTSFLDIGLDIFLDSWNGIGNNHGSPLVAELA